MTKENARPILRLALLAILRLAGLTIVVWSLLNLTTRVVAWVGIGEAARRGGAPTYFGGVPQGVGFTLILTPILHSMIGTVLFLLAPLLSSMSMSDSNKLPPQEGRPGAASSPMRRLRPMK